MSSYTLNLRTESHIATAVTVEKDDHRELRLEMGRFVGELLRDHAEQLWADEDWRVDVSDETGLILYVIEVCATRSPATSGEEGEKRDR